MLYLLLADAVLALHVGIVLFVVGGLVLVLLGHRRGWRWVDGPGFRWAHLLAIAVVALQAWWGVVCPLTTLEMWLRQQAGGAIYAGGFVEHWLQRLLYFNAPAWAFTLAYTAFAGAVALAWWCFPPRHGGRREPADGAP